MKLNCKDIRVDGGTQPREKIDFELVREYAEARANGDEFPPADVFFDGENYWLADGFHRYHAAYIQPDGNLECTVHQGSRRDAVLFSTGANAVHGLRRTNADKRRAVVAILSDPEWAKWSDREIARRTRVSHMLVAQIREELSGNSSRYGERVVQRGGSTYTMTLPQKAVEEAQERAEAGENIGIEEAKEILSRHEDDGMPEELFQEEPGKAVVYSPKNEAGKEIAAAYRQLAEEDEGEPIQEDEDAVGEEPEEIAQDNKKTDLRWPELQSGLFYPVDDKHKVVINIGWKNHTEAQIAWSRPTYRIIKAELIKNSMPGEYCLISKEDYYEKFNPLGPSRGLSPDGLTPDYGLSPDAWYLYDTDLRIICMRAFSNRDEASAAIHEKAAQIWLGAKIDAGIHDMLLVSWQDYLKRTGNSDDDNMTIVTDLLESLDNLLDYILNQPELVNQAMERIDLSSEAYESLKLLLEKFDTGV